jgi:5-methyltetrahydrofolate--homocysteine methyltransferase
VTMLEALAHRTLVADGAMGTELQRAGLPLGEGGEAWNLQHADRVAAVHAAYADAGCDIILTNTFGATRWILERHGLDGRLDDVNRAAARIARSAAGGARFVLGDLGPTGQLLAPLGALSIAELQADATKRARALLDEGVDGLICETLTSIDEAAVVVEAARVAGAACVIASFAFDRRPNGRVRTMMGAGPDEAARCARDAGASLVGLNCGTHLDLGDCARLAAELAAASGLPVMVQPNAGQPRLEDARAVYDMSPEAFAEGMDEVLSAGAAVVGGCCGTRPAHIRALRGLVDGRARR